MADLPPDLGEERKKSKPSEGQSMVMAIPNPQFERGCWLSDRSVSGDAADDEDSGLEPQPGDWQGDDFDLDEAEPQPGDFWLEPDELDDSAAAHPRRAHQENDACWR